MRNVSKMHVPCSLLGVPCRRFYCDGGKGLSSVDSSLLQEHPRTGEVVTRKWTTPSPVEQQYDRMIGCA